MKILFKVIVLVSILVCCYILWKLYNNFNINKGQFAISYGLAILAGGLFVGWLTDLNLNNQSLYDNREADPLSDWVKIQDRAKGKGDFWKGLLSDSDMDERLQWELSNQYDSKELQHEPPYIPGRPKSKQLFSKQGTPLNIDDKGRVLNYMEEDGSLVHFDEVNSVSPEKFRELATGIEFEKRELYREDNDVSVEDAKGMIEQLKKDGRPTVRQPYERYAGWQYDTLFNALSDIIAGVPRTHTQTIAKHGRRMLNKVPTDVADKQLLPLADRYNDGSIKQPKNPYFKGLYWVLNETGGAIDPLKHEQSK